jgi:predicted ATP-dependent endonuclease of OLD family
MKLLQLKIKNYKCFGNEPQGFEGILPLNIIIGKNNSGKSSVLDMVKSFINEEQFNRIKTNFPQMTIVYDTELTENLINRIYPKNTRGGNIPGSNHYEYGQNFIGDKISIELRFDNTQHFLSSTRKMIAPTNDNNSLITHAVHPLRGKLIKSINAERDILPETNRNSIELMANGTGATWLIQEILNSSSYDSTLIEGLLLKGLNSITFPEIQFSRILVQKVDGNNWEIFLEDKNSTRIALSKMGSGIKTIIQVLLNLIVLPKLEKKKESDYVFLFEELENNLHPSIQRRLFNYIKDFAVKFDTTFFITTHSNVVIDSFGGNENAQIVHVSDNKINTVTCSKDINNVLDDLELKASDIFQSNGIIWVEGPSDRNFLNKWLQILAPELKEGLHYSIMFYGGKLLSNLSFDYIESELVPLLKINRNAYVIIDKDRRNINQEVNKTKQRIEEEIGRDKCWITSGIEIENYLTESTINNWLQSKVHSKLKYKEEKFKKFDEVILKKWKLDYSLKKNSLSKEISNFITEKDLSILDLNSKLKDIVRDIEIWNKLSLSDIRIIEATYGVTNNLVDVKDVLQEQVSRGVISGPVDPSSFGIPDPIYGTVKTLSIKCRINGREKGLTFKDGDVYEIK